MRRREKFVLIAGLLSFLLWGLQYLVVDWRYWGVIGFAVVVYFFSAFALSDDLQPHEWLTILPLPSLYALAVGLYYFLLPANLLTQAGIIFLFGLGMYALYLTSNIFSVAKGRTIQLLYAAHTISLFFTIFISLLLLQVIFSLRWPFYSIGVVVFLTHFLLVLMFLWSADLEPRIDRSVWWFTSLITLLTTELAILLSFLPMPVWHSALLIMSVLYIYLGVAWNYLKSRLFQNTVNEYALVAFLVGLVFILLFPAK